MLTLQDSTICLMPLAIEHFDALLKIADECPNTWQYTPNTALGAENMHSYIQKALVKRAAGSHLPFVVQLKASGEIVGSTRFYDINEHHKTVSIGYSWLHTKMRGKGINRRAKFLMLQHAFENWDMCRVNFTADVNNTTSISALLNIGCTLEGVLRSDIVLANGRRRNTAVLSILRHEWHDRVKNMLALKIES
ncbi:MAG: GNAT family protein [Neisseria sp.]|nr:GNAT family protein [Neisseria sp.]